MASTPAETEVQKALYKLLMGGIFPQPPPAGKELRKYYFGSWTKLYFKAEPGLIARAQWQSPVFWLRPDMGDLNTGETFNAIPLWRTGSYGGGLTLFVEIAGISSLSSIDVTVTSQEWASAQPANQLLTIDQAQDITADVYDGGDMALLQFTPPTGGGGPILFWKVALQFDQETAGAPDLRIRASAY